MFRVDERYVRKHLTRLDSQITGRLADIARTARHIPGLSRLVFHVAPEWAFKTLPVDTMTFSDTWQPLASELNDVPILPNIPFFEAALDYPIGRHDWIGVDTMPDWHLVLNEITLYLSKCWRDSQSLNSATVFVGHVYNPVDFYDEPSKLLNVGTNASEAVSINWGP